MNAAAAAYSRFPEVAYVEPNYAVHAIGSLRVVNRLRGLRFNRSTVSLPIAIS